MNDHLENMVRDVSAEIVKDPIYMTLWSPTQRNNCTHDALTLHNYQKLWNYFV